jgi:hypothetical protein
MTIERGLQVIMQALRLNPYLDLNAPGALRLALLVVFLAGLSQALGQSVVLFVNQVKPRRFLASLLLAAVLYVFGFVFLVISIWLVAGYVFGKQLPLADILKAVGLAYAPYLFSFFILTPYFGSFLSVFLSLWSLAALLRVLRFVLELSLLEALACSILGWLLLQLSQRTIGRPLQRLVRAIKGWVAGQKLENPKDLRDFMRERSE